MPSAPPTNHRLHLPLVLPEHELSGNFPPAFERAVLACDAGDERHRAVVLALEPVIRQALEQCVPPAPRAAHLETLDAVHAWAQSSRPFTEQAALRAATFDEVSRTERRTLQAVEHATNDSFGTDPLATHARRVVRRYVARAVHHSVAALLMGLDGVRTPRELLPIPSEAAGAIAYERVGLGPARDARLRDAALRQAEWEQKRLIAVEREPLASLALQLFQEYLGVHWKNQADAMRLHLEDQIENTLRIRT